jgi:hypothetical protein
LLRFFTLYITPLIAVIILLLRIPAVESLLKEKDQDGPAYIAGLLVFCTILNHLITVFSPFKKYERIARNKWAILDFIAERFVAKYQAMNFNIRLNIMIAEPAYFHFIEPKKKNNRKRRFTFAGKVFKVIWCYGNQKADKKLLITTNQGVCGKAYTHGKGVVGAATPWNLDNFNFNTEQINLTQHLIIVASCPIFGSENYLNRQNDKIIAVLNVESDSVGSEVLIHDPQRYDTFAVDIVTLTRIFNKVL